MTGMTIAALAREGGVGVETVRYYQRRGLLDEPDRPTGAGAGGGIRRYGTDDARRLRFIRSAQAAGFTLEQIGELLALDGIGALSGHGFTVAEAAREQGPKLRLAPLRNPIASGAACRSRPNAAPS